MAPVSFLSPGQSLDSGRYQVRRRIARGGLGEVWAGVTDQGYEVALKTMRPDRADDTAAVLAFLGEARHGMAVNHPGVVRTFGRIEGDVPPPGVIIQDLVPGRSLESMVHQYGPLATGRAMAMMAQLARALHAIHRADLVHRDVSAVNIMVDDADHPVLIDFGIAAPIGAPSVTRNLTVPGNPEYLAPELTRGRPASPAADIYSLGIVLLEALTGTKPFSRATPEATATAHVMYPSPDPPAHLPRDTRNFMALLVSKDPARRPQSALAVARLLEAWAA
jgi:serine/threonine-protein kinase